MSTLGSLPASARRSSVAPKLRDSCQGCAVSKLKCSRERPTCARCAKRGMVCEYFVTKRGGRRPTSRLNASSSSSSSPKMDNSLNIPAPATSASSPSSLSSFGGTADSLTPPGLMQMSLGNHHHSPSSPFPDILPGIVTPADPTTTPSPASLTTTHLDCFNLPIPLSILDTQGPDYLNPADTAAFFLQDNALTVFDEAVFDLPSVPKPQTQTHPASRPSVTDSLQSARDYSSDPGCSCLLRALGLLKQLFPNASSSSTCMASLFPGQFPTIHSVIVENEQIIAVLNTMLQCPCSQDGYLLAIISLIVFKMMGWYAAAARETPLSHSNFNSSRGGSAKSHLDYGQRPHSEQVFKLQSSVDGEYEGRMAAQLVLSELHRVQQLINVLSQRLKAHGLQTSGVESPSSPDCFYFLNQDSSAFPVTMLGQLEVDLRKRLQTLSVEIVDILRRG
ncbi:hypothetical protein MAP00_008564 [Monascus purpureus]|nr:hypothetical protein MAP00_008564 [Monascus purpureus]